MPSGKFETSPAPILDGIPATADGPLLADWLKCRCGYGDFMTVRSADNLRVCRNRDAPVVVLEYEVHGESVQTGRPYDNRFVSMTTVKDHKVTHWRDYLDPIAVFDAAGCQHPSGLPSHRAPSGR